MSRFLIVEPSADVRLLLELAVARLGHEPVSMAPSSREDPPPADVLVVETAAEGALAIARRLRERRANLPIVVCSVHPSGPDVEALDPVAHLLKPFSRAALEAALTAGADALPNQGLARLISALSIGTSRLALRHR